MAPIAIINPMSTRMPGQKASKNHKIPRPMMKTPKDIAPHSPPPDPGGPKQASLSLVGFCLGLALSSIAKGFPHEWQNFASSFNSAPHFLQKGTNKASVTQFKAQLCFTRLLMFRSSVQRALCPGLLQGYVVESEICWWQACGRR